MLSPSRLHDSLGTGPILVGGLIVFGSVAAAYLSSKTLDAEARRNGAKLPPGPERTFLIGK